jgi:hemolysin activation/secretion protein
LQSIDPNDSTFGFANYSIPLFNIAHELAFAWDSHEYDSIDSRLGSQVLIHGEVDSFYFGYNYKWRRSKGLNVQFGLRGFEKQSDTSVDLPSGGNTQISKQKTDVKGALISSGGDVLLRRSRTIVGWQASLLYGEQDDASNFRIADDYTRFALDSKSITVLPWGPGADISHLSVRFVGAYSDDLLPSFEQTPLGGPFGVRAYKSHDFTADTMAFLNLEWRVEVGQHLFGSLADDNSLRLGVFAEAGYGEANGFDTADDSSVDLSAYGLLLSYRWRESFTVEASLAFPGHDSTSDDFTGEITDDDYNFLFDVRYVFY